MPQRFLICLASLALCALSTRAENALPTLPNPNIPAPQPLPLPLEEKSTRQIAPGIELTTLRRNVADAPLQMFITKVRPQGGVDANGKNVSWKLQVAPAEYSVLKASTVSTIAKRENAIVAINGGYFAFGGAALGAVKVDNEWIRLPWKNRTAMGVSENGEVLVENLSGQALVRFKDKDNREVLALPLANYNGYAPRDGVTLLTRRVTGAYPIRPDELAIEVQDWMVRSRVESGSVNVRPNGWTIIAHGAARQLLNNVQVGQTANLEISSPTIWQKYSTILGAGPRLLKNGAIYTTEKEEEFRPDVIARGPRSAFGTDKDGNWIFLVADGREKEYSAGLSIPELAREMRLAGATEAICLDGGGSSALVANGEVLNRPSDGQERRVANALCVVLNDQAQR